MTPDTITYACVRTDTGLVSELVHVSPVFIRCGAPRRGRHEEQRLARVRRSEARGGRRSRHFHVAVEANVEVLEVRSARFGILS